MMKKTIIKILAIALAICFVLPLVACTTTRGDRETSTKKPSQTSKETKNNEDDNPDEPAETNNKSETSICFVGSDASSPKSVFFDSLDEAVAAYPDGAVIKLCFQDELTIDKPFHFPDTGNYVLDFNDRDLNITFDGGYVLECKSASLKRMQYVYYNNLETLISDNTKLLDSVLEPQLEEDKPVYIPYLWVFEETEDMEVGRYAISNIHVGEEDVEPEFKFERVEDLEKWGVQYEASSAGLYYYDLQSAIDASTSAYNQINVLKTCSATNEENTFIIPDNGCYYRIAYDYHLVYGKFNDGVTFDDGAGGYCFYSSVQFLSSRDVPNNSTVWIWGTYSGYEPGKYRLTLMPADWTEDKALYDEDTGNYFDFAVKPYRYTRSTEENTGEDDFFPVMEKDYEKSKEAGL